MQNLTKSLNQKDMNAKCSVEGGKPPFKGQTQTTKYAYNKTHRTTKKNKTTPYLQPRKKEPQPKEEPAYKQENLRTTQPKARA